MLAGEVTGVIGRNLAVAVASRTTHREGRMWLQDTPVNDLEPA